MSCEGHLERAMGAPWVRIEVKGNEKLRLQMIHAFEEADKAELEGKTDTELEILYDEAHALSSEVKRPVLESAKKAMELIMEFYSKRAKTSTVKSRMKPVLLTRSEHSGTKNPDRKVVGFL